MQPTPRLRSPERAVKHSSGHAKGASDGFSCCRSAIPRARQRRPRPRPLNGTGGDNDDGTPIQGGARDRCRCDDRRDLIRLHGDPTDSGGHAHPPRRRRRAGIAERPDAPVPRDRTTAGRGVAVASPGSGDSVAGRTRGRHLREAVRAAGVHPGRRERQRGLRAFGDSILVCTTYDTARRAAGGGAHTYLYNFAREIPIPVLQAVDLRAFHGSEIVYVFGSITPPTPDDGILGEACVATGPASRAAALRICTGCSSGPAWR